ncbi:MAG: diguanylate cyclase (GGDEF) protein [candidate division NC10 bacterium]|nr:diguanylate cyclase (GGDEF) protein [candidate division NC10 bacterium]
MTLGHDRRSLRFAVVAGVVWSAFSLAYVLGPLGDDSHTWVANIGTLLGAWSVVVLALLLWRSCAPDETARRIWQALLLGFLLWAVGDTLWAFYDLLPGGEIPYPSPADLAWRSMEVRPGRGQRLALSLIVLVGLVVFGYVLWPTLTYTGYDRLIEQALDVFYPIGGFLLFAGSVLVAAAVRGGRLWFPWQVIALGIAVLSLADLVFAYATWNNLYIIEGPPNVITILADAPYMGAYAAIAVGEYVLGRLEGTF